MKKIALIGIGNILFHDEGLGAYLVKYIEENFEIPPTLDIVEGGTLGFKLMAYYQAYDKIIVVGTGSQEGSVGTIHVESAQEVMAKSPIRKTANEVEITMMIEICSFHEDMGEVVLVTMIPEDIVEVKNGLTPATLSHMPHLVERVLEVLKQSGVVLHPKAEQVVSFDEIIDAYANPKAPVMV